MSNITDGKAALKAGNFQTAEKKLLLALDTHPDDGEVWWALMLVKCECRSDAELRQKLTDEFYRAAKSGGKQPTTPLDTPYGKNALRYAKGDVGEKRRAFVDELNAELDGIWRAERGSSIKVREVKTITPRKKPSPLNVCVYVMLGLSAVFGGLSAYAVVPQTDWLIWTAFALFVALEAGVAVILFRIKDADKKPRAAVALAIAIGFVIGIIMFLAGFIQNMRAVLIASAVVICIAAAVAAFKLIPAKKQEKTQGGGAREKRGKPEKPRVKKPESTYEDEFD